MSLSQRPGRLALPRRDGLDAPPDDLGDEAGGVDDEPQQQRQVVARQRDASEVGADGDGGTAHRHRPARGHPEARVQSGRLAACRRLAGRSEELRRADIGTRRAGRLRRLAAGEAGNARLTVPVRHQAAPEAFDRQADHGAVTVRRGSGRGKLLTRIEAAVAVGVAVHDALIGLVQEVDGEARRLGGIGEGDRRPLELAPLQRPEPEASVGHTARLGEVLGLGGEHASRNVRLHRREGEPPLACVERPVAVLVHERGHHAARLPEGGRRPGRRRAPSRPGRTPPPPPPASWPAPATRRCQAGRRASGATAVGRTRPRRRPPRRSGTASRRAGTVWDRARAAPRPGCSGAPLPTTLRR